MRTKTKGHVLRVALVTVAAPVAGWALEQAARRAKTRGTTSPTSRRLRQGADFVQHLGRGPLADRLGRRPATTLIRADREPQQTDQHGGSPTAAAPAPGAWLRRLPARPLDGLLRVPIPAPPAHGHAQGRASDNR